MSETSQNAGQSDGGEASPEVAWVGQQYRMDGYCGRAETTATATTTNEANMPEGQADELRPVAVVRRAKRSQGRVVRIGPPRQPQQQVRDAA